MLKDVSDQDINRLSDCFLHCSITFYNRIAYYTKEKKCVKALSLDIKNHHSHKHIIGLTGGHRGDRQLFK